MKRWLLVLSLIVFGTVNTAAAWWWPLPQPLPLPRPNFPLPRPTMPLPLPGNLPMPFPLPLPQPTSPGIANNSDLVAGTFANEYGERQYRLYVPKTYEPNGTKRYPLVVMLHGCTQNGEDFLGGTKIGPIADREEFIVLFPVQDLSNNIRACWNWFMPEHQARGIGEPSIIVGMLGRVAQNYRVDTSRVYLAGMSAGAAMSAIIASCYPDVFAAVGIHSGLQFQAATSVSEAFQAMSSGAAQDPRAAGEAAYRCSGQQRKPIPMAVFQGDRDGTVNPVNGEQIFAQFATMNDWMDDGRLNGSITLESASQTSGQVANGRRYSVSSVMLQGKQFLLHFSVQGMGHSWSGGDSHWPYNDPAGPEASELLWSFFKEHRR